MDKIFINGLQLAASIGVHPWEKEVKQKLILDLVLETDFTKAAAKDDLSATIDYSAVAGFVQNLTEETHYQLLEALGEQLATGLLENFPLQGLKLTLCKPGAIPKCREVGIEIYRAANHD